MGSGSGQRTTASKPLTAALLCVLLAAGVCASPIGRADADERAALVERQAVEPVDLAADDSSLIVRFAPGVGAAKQRAIVDSVDGNAEIDRATDLGLERTVRVEVADGDVDEILGELEADEAVVSAEPNITFTPDATPDDPEFYRQWHLENTGQTVGQPGVPGADIAALEAWDVRTDGFDSPIAVIDTGVDMSLPDIAPNVWKNPGESGDGRETNGIDDDNNGFVDDWRGWDFYGDDNDPTDFDGHGTMMTGAAAAAGNNGIGGSGVAWDAEVMPLKASRDTPGSDGNPISINLLAVLQAVAYADMAGAKIVNMSFSSNSWSDAFAEAIRSRPHMLFVASAGNGNEDNDDPFDQLFPCSYPYRNVICVAASDHKDNLAGISATGKRNVDLAAPGLSIFTPHPIRADFPTGYVIGTGTSHAAAIVSGAAAVVRSHFEAGNGSEPSVPFLRARLLNNVDRRPAFELTTASKGRLNLHSALVAPPKAVLGRTIKPKPKKVKAGGRGAVRVVVESNGDIPLTGIEVCGKASKKFVKSIGCKKRGTLAIGKTVKRDLRVKLKKKARPGRVIQVKVKLRADGIGWKSKIVRVKVR